MADISKITLPSGTTYDFKDAAARSQIEAMSSSKIYIGESQTPISDGATIAQISVLYEKETSTVTPVAGQFVTYGAAEYVVGQDNVWHKFGDTSDHGKLAYKDSATGSVTANGTVSQPSFQGEAGSVSVSGTPKGSVSIATGTGTANYTPSGSVSVIPTVTMNTTTVNSITGVGTLPSLTTSVSDETLAISWNAGTLPTKGADTSVATGIKSATATGSFSGTGVQLTGSFTGEATTSTGSFTPKGTVSQPAFTGKAVTITVE